MSLQLFVRNTSDVVIVDLAGRATIGPENDFLNGQLQQLIDAGTSKMLLNLADLTLVDSSSIGSIVKAFTCLRRRGSSLKLLGPRGNVRVVLEMVRLLDLIPTIEEEAQAIASFSEKGASVLSSECSCAFIG
jgi:anti-sigma B factor antagonist